jgi:hypothetical protein
VEWKDLHAAKRKINLGVRKKDVENEVSMQHAPPAYCMAF